MFLNSMCTWIPGVAAAVGSAKASVLRKVQALSHSQRLTAQGWVQTARLLNSTVSWTGDLGTESGFWRFVAPLTAVHGEWVKQEDGNFNLDGGDGEPRRSRCRKASSPMAVLLGHTAY